MGCRWTIVVMACAAFLLSVFPAAAQDWKVGESFGCEYSGGTRVCRFEKSRTGLSATVTITNPQAERPVFFTWGEHHSVCGVPGSYIHVEEMQVDKGGSTTVRLLDPGLGVTCRMVVLAHCYVKDDAGSKRFLPCDQYAIYAQAKTFVGNRE